MCIESQNTTIFISGILGIYYNRHNYMFRPLMLAIFRLYMNLSSSYTACVRCFLGREEGVILCGTEISFVSMVGASSGTLSLVIHSVILAMSKMGFIILY